jgi:predicted site-specific integrase-resolvase
MITNSYISGKEVKKLIKVSDNTLRRWANQGKIKYTRNTPKGKRFYDVSSIISDIPLYNTLSNNIEKLSLVDKLDDTLNKNQDSNSPEMSKNDIVDNPTIDKLFKEKQIYCYCRVSTEKQMNKLNIQIKLLEEHFPNAVIISDIGENNEWNNRKGILRILKDMKDNKIKELIVYDKRIIYGKSYDLIKYILSLYDINILILKNH